LQTGTCCDHNNPHATKETQRYLRHSCQVTPASPPCIHQQREQMPLERHIILQTPNLGPSIWLSPRNSTAHAACEDLQPQMPASQGPVATNPCTFCPCPNNYLPCSHSTCSQPALLRLCCSCPRRCCRFAARCYSPGAAQLNATAHHCCSSTHCARPFHTAL
jgi:hypothetical protein